MRIESAYIADHVEVDPTTRTLDVRTGFQSYVKVPGLPFRHVLGLAIVVQVAFDEYDHPFSLAIDVERVDDLPVMHHEDFTFEIPHGIGAGEPTSTFHDNRVRDAPRSRRSGRPPGDRRTSRTHVLVSQLPDQAL